MSIITMINEAREWRRKRQIRDLQRDIYWREQAIRIHQQAIKHLQREIDLLSTDSDEHELMADGDMPSCLKGSNE